jgi:hypothetical protein
MFGENKSLDMIIYGGITFAMTLFITIIFLSDVTRCVVSFFVTLWMLLLHIIFIYSKSIMFATS